RRHDSRIRRKQISLPSHEMYTMMILVVHVQKNTVLLDDEYFATQPEDSIQFLRRQLIQRFIAPVYHIGKYISNRICLPKALAGICAALPPGHSYPDRRILFPAILSANIPAKRNCLHSCGCIDNPSRNRGLSSAG